MAVYKNTSTHTVTIRGGVVVNPGKTVLICGKVEHASLTLVGTRDRKPTASDLADGSLEALPFYDSEGRMEYYAESVAGASTASACWRIKKMTYDENGRLASSKFANGDSGFTHVCDDRESLNY